VGKDVKTMGSRKMNLFVTIGHLIQEERYERCE